MILFYFHFEYLREYCKSQESQHPLIVSPYFGNNRCSKNKNKIITTYIKKFKIEPIYYSDDVNNNHISHKKIHYRIHRKYKMAMTYGKNK